MTWRLILSDRENDMEREKYMLNIDGKELAQFIRQETERNKGLYGLKKCLLPSECLEKEPDTATELVRMARHRAFLHEYMCEPVLRPADKTLDIREPATENILKDIGGINMDGKGFVEPSNIDRVIIRTRDGREFEGTVTRAEYMPGPYGAAGYSDLTVRTLKQTSKGNYGIKEVIFNNPATIVKWDDETQTVVCCQDNVEEIVKETTKIIDGEEVTVKNKVRKPRKAKTFNPEIGLAMAIVKKHFGNLGNYNNVFHKYIPESREERKTEEKAEE